jgi:hypothetical protein
VLVDTDSIVLSVVVSTSQYSAWPINYGLTRPVAPPRSGDKLEGRLLASAAQVGMLCSGDKDPINARWIAEQKPLQPWQAMAPWTATYVFPH